MVNEDKVREVLEKKVVPVLAAEGGEMELVEVKEGRVRVRLGGACAFCPFRSFTIKSFIKNVLKKEIPEVEAVETVEKF